MDQLKLSVVVPIFNEAENILPLYTRLISTIQSITKDYEIIFVNDASMDNSLEIIKSMASENSKIHYISLSRNFGHQAALFAGLQHAKGEHIVSIDADLQDPPELISEMYEKAQTGYDVVYAQRSTRKDKSVIKKFCYTLFYKLMTTLSQTKIPEHTGDYRLISRQVNSELVGLSEYNKFLRGQIAWLGFRQTHVTYERDARQAGEAGYSFRKLFRLAFDGIISFSNFPLRMATIMGFVALLIAFVLMGYTFYSYFMDNKVPQGWPSLMITILFIGGVQLLSLGIIGEYIGRLFNDVKNRPVYIIKDSDILDSKVD